MLHDKQWWWWRGMMMMHQDSCQRITTELNWRLLLLSDHQIWWETFTPLDAATFVIQLIILRVWVEVLLLFCQTRMLLLRQSSLFDFLTWMRLTDSWMENVQHTSQTFPSTLNEFECPVLTTRLTPLSVLQVCFQQLSNSKDTTGNFVKRNY